MKNIILIVLLLPALNGNSQKIYTRPFSQIHIRWDDQNELYEKDSTEIQFKVKNPKIILSFDEIHIIDNDTLKFYLNVTPEMSEDSVSIDRIWEDANDENGRTCMIFLYYFKKENEYGFRILYDDDNTGIEYHMMALKVDTIPYKKD